MYGMVRVENGKAVICEKDEGRLRLFRTLKETKKVTTYLNQSAVKYGWKYKYFAVGLPVIKDYSQY